MIVNLSSIIHVTSKLFQCLNLSPEVLAERLVEVVDIAYDEVNPKHYKEEEVNYFVQSPGNIFSEVCLNRYSRSVQDVRYFQSQKTGRGPLIEGWRDKVLPIMCSYKLVQVSFEVWGLQTKAEEMIQRVSLKIPI